MAERHEISFQRLVEALRTSLGAAVLKALDDPNVVEVYANDDGGVWVEIFAEGRSWVGDMSPHDRETVIRLVADQMGLVADRDHPLVSGTLFEHGERFQGALPPVVPAPAFCIRKGSPVVFTLDDYVKHGSMSESHAVVLRDAAIGKNNILIAGGTGSGKTTLVNAVLAEEAFALDRLLILEDTPELKCVAPDRVHLLTKDTEPAVDMTALLKSALRLRPDRIVVGEVRGPEALALLKAWNTGHPGGVSTLHANSAGQALQRLEDLVGETSTTVSRRAIADAIDLVVYIERGPQGPQVTTVAQLMDYRQGSYVLKMWE